MLNKRLFLKGHAVKLFTKNFFALSILKECLKIKWRKEETKCPKSNANLS